MSVVNLTRDPKYVLCYTPDVALHYIRLDPGAHLDTGEEFTRVYLTRDELASAIDLLFPDQEDRDDLQRQDDLTEGRDVT